MIDSRTFRERSIRSTIAAGLQRLPERLLPWLVLTILLYYSYGLFLGVPYAGVEYDAPEERVSSVFVESDALQPGDVLLRVGSVTVAEMRRRGSPAYFFRGATRGETVPVEIERNGMRETVVWRVPGFTWSELLHRLHSLWWLPYVFWMSGTFTLLLIRPRDDRRRLLTAFNYLAAIWLAAGLVSQWKFGYSRGVFRAALWLTVPVALHLHRVFPSRVPLLPRWLRNAAYLLAGMLAVGEFFHLLPGSLYWYGFLLLLGGSSFIILRRLLFRPEERRELGLLLGIILLVLIPPLIVSVARLLGRSVPDGIASGSSLALPAMPGAYFYILYRRQLGPRRVRARRWVNIYVGAVALSILVLLLFDLAAVMLDLEDSLLFLQSITLLFFAIGAALGFAPFFSLPVLADPALAADGEGGTGLRLRANRLLTPFFFMFGGIILLPVTVIILDRWLDDYLLFLGVALIAFLGGSVAYRPLESAIDRYLLGIRLPPAHLLERFAQRITTTLDRESLTRLLCEEILPSLLVRQSALLHFRERDRAELLFSYGVDQLPPCERATLLEAPMGTSQHPLPAGTPQWVRLLIPLRLGEQIIGCWLWGARDPDDLYRPEDIRILQALADQTAIALTNIIQAENLHALYQAHIDGREQERTRLARALHDEILNELATLNIYVEEAAPPFYAAYEKLSTRLRATISDLRPAMLTYGVGRALEESVDDWQARAGSAVALVLAVDPAGGRYPPQVEEHLFRIVQQAVENALKHAHADVIRLEGSLYADGASLSVRDNGVGFSVAKEPNLRTLLAEKHFGLVGMYERAELIGANVVIHATPGDGTTVTVRWTRPGAA